MPLTRRSFLRGVGGGLAAVPLVTGRGMEAAWSHPLLADRAPGAGLIRIDSNENPNGPSKAALAAIRDALGEVGRYPDDFERNLVAAVAKAHSVTADQVLVGCGSTEHLRIAVDAFANAGAGLVTAAPSFENSARYAERRGVRVAAVPVGRDLGLDLDAMLDQANGAGLVYFCNPNNPTGTVHGRADAEEFVRRVLAKSPATTVLVDEAYFEYVDLPGYGTLIPMALADSRVVVLRTMSKVHGMAGLRVGYAVGSGQAIGKMAAFRLDQGVNVLAAAAAIASLDDARHLQQEQLRNREVRAFTRGFFEGKGYDVAASHTNFMMVSIRRPIEEFRKACANRGVAIGRPFPPLGTHARISIGTMNEMRQAVRVFDEILATTGS